MKNLPLYLAILFLSLLCSCDTKDEGAIDEIEEEINDDDEEENLQQDIEVETVATGLANPWGMAFLPDGRILITERAGDIRIVENGMLVEEKVEGVPPVRAQGQGGLLDIILHPDYEENGWIYMTYAKEGPGGGATTLLRAKLEGNNLTDLEELFVAMPFFSSGQHFGSRIAFDNEGYVYITTGDRGNMQNAQDLSNHYGKVIRLHDDGAVPDDNPFVDEEGAMPEIWSYGHRNPQGLYFDKANNRLWEHEHGPQGGDEINIIEKGRNYGWPEITYGVNYGGGIISEDTEKEGMEQPVHYWDPSIAPCGMTMATSDYYPDWKGNLFIGALVLQHVNRVVLSDTEYVSEERLLQGNARVRAIVESPQGRLYIATESPGALLRLVNTLAEDE